MGTDLTVAVIAAGGLSASPFRWSSPPSIQGGAYRPVSVIIALNTLGYTHDIRDASGQLWRFQPHQFRHTLGTQMINNGVPQHIVQRYLGHASPEMTSRYALVRDETLKAAFQQFHGRLIDIHGQGIPATAPVDAPALQWFKRQIFAQALPNGYCGLPVMAGPCPHANACLTCTHFRTDSSFLPIHQEQLTATERLIAHAQSQGWTRQAEMNMQIKTNLETIIIALEESSNAAPAQHDGPAPECPGAAPGGTDSHRDGLADDAADGPGD